MNISVISAVYPNPEDPTFGVFVRNLVQEMINQGIKAQVVSPRKLVPSYLKGRLLGRDWSHDGVYRPLYISLSNKQIGKFNTAAIGAKSFTRAVIRQLERMPRPDLIYSHFLFPSGLAAGIVGNRFGIPAVVTLGESSILSSEKRHGLKSTQAALQRLDKIIVVSSELRDYCIERGAVHPEKITVIPNAVNEKNFRPRDRSEARARLGLAQDEFIVSFTGHFINRKGPLRLLAALKRFPRVKAVFLGSGPEQPVGEQVLLSERVPHDQLPDWLAASDIFVLPTLAEGSCNAINEALAMGLPVISSDIPSIREQTDAASRTLVDPMNVDAIADAIEELINNPAKREAMAMAALQQSKGKTLSARARKTIDVFKSLVE